MTMTAMNVDDDFVLAHPSADVRPPLKWAGGKRQLLDRLRRWFPTQFDRYREPFLGGGAVFFDLSSRGHLVDCPTVLSDTNGDLVGCYLMVRDHVEDVIISLKDLEKGHERNTNDHYYAVRERFNSARRCLHRGSHQLNAREYTSELAAQFIYLNRTGFNGLFRLNASGGFNVPSGKYKDPKICNAEGLRAAASFLNSSSVELVQGDFDAVLGSGRPGDFVYLDPPYHPISATANFTGYTAHGFTDEDQHRLQRRVIGLAREGAWVLLSNSTAPLITHLYVDDASARAVGLTAHTVSAKRAISSKGSGRSAVMEYVITNAPSRA